MTKPEAEAALERFRVFGDKEYLVAVLEYLMQNSEPHAPTGNEGER